MHSNDLASTKTCLYHGLGIVIDCTRRVHARVHAYIYVGPCGRALSPSLSLHVHMADTDMQGSERHVWFIALLLVLTIVFEWFD